MIHVWGVTDKGEVRPQNQDGFYLELFSEDSAVGVVCDGMGGARAGNIASLIAVETFVDVVQSLREELEEEPQAVLNRAAAQANSAVYSRAETDPDCRGMGTTMVAALVLGRTAHLLNIGDSRCYHISGEGIRRVTRDHSVVEDMVARGDITPEEARNHPRKNLITRALGAEGQVKADLYRQELTAGDFLLLCSDGLSNIVTDQELLYEVLYGGVPEECCKRLLNIALSRGAPDNVTAVLMEIL